VLINKQRVSVDNIHLAGGKTINQSINQSINESIGKQAVYHDMKTTELIVHNGNDKSPTIILICLQF